MRIPGLRVAPLIPWGIALCLAGTAIAEGRADEWAGPNRVSADERADAARPAAGGGPEFQIRAVGGATSRFWSTVDQLRSREITPAALDGLFDSLVDSPKEQVATLDLRYDGSTSDAIFGIFDRGFFGIGGEQLAGGSVRDRIYPELQGYEIYTAHVEAGFHTRLPRRGDGWEYGLSATAGGGRENLVQGAAAEILGAADPVAKSTVLYWGGEAFLGHATWWSDEVRTHTRLTFRPTAFYAGDAGDSFTYRVISHQIAPRWKAESEWLGSLDTPWPGTTDVGLIFVGGQQPVPVDLLPRTWDSVHDVRWGGEFGSLVGAGGTLQLFSPSERYQLRLVGGFFGGYPGAGAELVLSHFVITGGTWGIEQTSEYRTEESRFKYLALGVRIGI